MSHWPSCRLHFEPKPVKICYIDRLLALAVDQEPMAICPFEQETLYIYVILAGFWPTF